MLAYDVTTGQLVPGFAPVVNGQVRSVTATPDGSRVYIGGSFTSVDGQTRNRIAAFDTATGALVTGFAPPVNYDVYSVVATNSTVYAGGDFQGVGTRDRGYLAAFRATTGALLDWAPQAAGGKVWAIAINPEGTKVTVAGQFTTLNGSSSPGYGLGMVDATTGASLPMAANTVVRNGGADAAVVSLSSDGTNVYGSGYTFGAGGTLEGTFAASWDGGTLRWANDCHGDTYSVHARNGVLYSAGHTHYCGNMGGFPQTEPDWTFYRGLAFGTQATGVADRDPYGYANFKGQPTSSLLAWYPSINSGTFTGMNQGPWSVSGNQDYVVMGGEFTKVNNKAQQGLVRFPASQLSPNAQGPTLFSTTYPLNVSSTEAGTVRINWGSNQDIDNDALTYRVYRNVQLRSGLVHERRARARFWEPTTMGFTDTGLEPGSTHQYRVAVTDAAGNIANSPWTTVTVAATGTDSAYLKAVRASEPLDLWRLGDTGTTAPQDTLGATPLSTGTGVTKGAAGAVVGDADKAMSFNGTSNGIAWSTKKISPPRELTMETWFKTSSSSGGKLIGFGNRQNTSSSSYDRQIYLDNSGRVIFGVNDGALQTVASLTTYRNNAWHHVVATLSRTTGMKLYVDGVLVAEKATVIAGQGGYWGWWRIGGDNLSSWPSRPSSAYFNGSLDEVAVYNRGLDAAEVQAHYAAATGANLPPSASFTSAVSGLDVAVDAAGSSDPDGTVASYAWTFGDGGTGSGATATHRYASPGTYTVSLNVTDDDGATTTTTRQVVVSAPNQPPSASFTSAVSGLDVAVDAAGSSDPDGTVKSYAWTFGDGGTASGATATHSYASGGTFTVSLTVTDDDGASATSTRPVTVSGPNQPPSASFTSAVSGLDVAVDAGGSSDPDGTVASYAWAFGDGGTATGAMANHTYASAGSYEVTLTVTDDRGASNTIARQVTVGSPQAFATDAFERTVTGGWGSADLGGAWTGSGTASNFNVAGGVGTIRMGSAGSGPSRALTGVSSSNTEMRATIGVDKAATGGGTFVTLRPRVVASGDRYFMDTKFNAGGSVTIILGRNVGATETVLQSRAVTGLTVTPTDRLQVKVQAFGTSPTTFRAKVWKVGTPEPAAWTASVTDTTAGLQAVGSIGVGTYLSGSATNAPVLASFDDLWAGPTP